MRDISPIERISAFNIYHPAIHFQYGSLWARKFARIGNFCASDRPSTCNRVIHGPTHFRHRRPRSRSAKGPGRVPAGSGEAHSRESTFHEVHGLEITERMTARESRWQCRGQGFDPPHLHSRIKGLRATAGPFFVVARSGKGGGWACG